MVKIWYKNNRSSGVWELVSDPPMTKDSGIKRIAELKKRFPDTEFRLKQNK